MDKLNNPEDAKRFLRELGLRINEDVFCQIVNVLSGKVLKSLYSLYAIRPDKPAPICGKGTISKIQKLYNKGKLQPYLDYLLNSSAIGKIESEKTEETEHNVPTPDRESIETTTPEKSDICLSPPDNINVVVLKSWGVPIGQAPEIILSWRSWHRRGRHDICQLFPQFHEDILTRKIPFIKAKAILESEIRAKEFHDEKAHQDIDLARVYRPWESIKNQKALFQEIEERYKPLLEARKKHLNDVENLLKELREAVLGALETKKYDSLLKMEENPLFESLQRHCWDVYAFFWDLKRNVETAQYLESDTNTSEIDKTMGNDKRRELLTLQKNTITSVKQLRKAIDTSLRTKSYTKEWCQDCSRGAKTDTSS